jgi:hypothetical protein
MDREGTRHNCYSLRNSHRCGEVETTLLDLHGLLLSLVLIVLILYTSLILLPGVKAGIHKMPGFPTIIAASFIVVAGRWGCIGSSILLLKIWGTVIPLLKIFEFCTAEPQQDLEQLLYRALFLETRSWGPKNFRTELPPKDS